MSRCCAPWFLAARLEADSLAPKLKGFGAAVVVRLTAAGATIRESMTEAAIELIP
ncbi:MAG: hypothetical protein AAB363_00615 [Planctomycetota bacterium]